MNDGGQITDAYTWDAFGNLISSSGAGTANNVGAFGEYADSDTGLIYLRARWMNPGLGRFMSMDTNEGAQENPLSLHKYVYDSNDPVDRIDPTGNDDMMSLTASEPKVLWPNSLQFSAIRVDQLVYKGIYISNDSELHHEQTAGLQIILGALTKNRSNPNVTFKNPIYNWVQYVNASYSIPGEPSGWHLDVPPKSSIPYYYQNATEANNAQKLFPSYDEVFFDMPRAVLTTKHTTFEADLSFVATDSLNDLNFQPMVSFRYGFAFDVINGRTLNLRPEPITIDYQGGY